MATRLLAEFNLLEDGKDAVTLITLLSKRERQIISLVAKGFTNRKIADALFISSNTVKVHLRNIMEKLHAHTRQEAVNLVRE
jgi:two-component system NarL family response regulator